MQIRYRKQRSKCAPCTGRMPAILIMTFELRSGRSPTLHHNRRSRWTKRNRLRARRSEGQSVGKAQSAHLVAFLVSSLCRLRFVELLRRGLIQLRHISTQDRSSPGIRIRVQSEPAATASSQRAHPQLTGLSGREQFACNGHMEQTELID